MPLIMGAYAKKQAMMDKPMLRRAWYIRTLLNTVLPDVVLWEIVLMAEPLRFWEMFGAGDLVSFIYDGGSTPGCRRTAEIQGFVTLPNLGPGFRARGTAQTCVKSYAIQRARGARLEKSASSVLRVPGAGRSFGTAEHDSRG